MAIVAAGAYRPVPAPGARPRSPRRSARPPAPGTRAVASYDEDTTTMGVEAARIALAGLPADATAAAAAVRHRRSRLSRQDERHRDPRRARPRPDGRAYDLGGSARSGDRRAAARRRGSASRRSSCWPTCAPDCPAGPTSATAATARPRSWSRHGSDAEITHGARARLVDARVPRPLAPARASASSHVVGGALRRARVRPAGAGRVRRRVQGGRARRRTRSTT